MGEKKHESAFVCLRKLKKLEKFYSKPNSPVDCLSGRRAKRQIPLSAPKEESPLGLFSFGVMLN